MPSFLKQCLIISTLSLSLMLSPFSQAEQSQAPSNNKPTSNNELNLEEPLYSPFIERYVLDELKQLRIDLAAQKAELIQQILDREHSSVDRGVRYATDTITYFFYLIAAASSILVIVGWTSIRDIKERVHSFADQEVEKIVQEYEQRLAKIEAIMREKSVVIEENREEIELTQEIQALWLRAGRETNIHTQIGIYDQILQARKDDVEALSYKADAVLELGEPQWAINLCQQALAVDPECTQALYQLACAYTVLEQYDEAIKYLSEVLSRSDTFIEDVLSDKALKPLHNIAAFNELMQNPPARTSA